MHEPTLARRLSLLATDVDSLEKALVQAQGERAREQAHRKRADARAEELSQQLRHARRRAKTAERELAALSAGTDAAEHQAQTRERELRKRLEQEEQANSVLQHEVERIERERRALALNLREVLGNLRSAAQEAEQARFSESVAAEDATLVPARTPDTGW